MGAGSQHGPEPDPAEHPAATATTPRSGAGAGWTFTIQGDWDVGDTFTVSVDPGTYAGTKGVQCQVPYEPLGVNQSEPDVANYIGFSGFDGDEVDPPVVESTFPAGPAPTFDIYVDRTADPLLEDTGADVVPHAGAGGDELGERPGVAERDREPGLEHEPAAAGDGSGDVRRRLRRDDGPGVLHRWLAPAPRRSRWSRA